MIIPPAELTCFEYKRRMDGGFSRPFLFAAYDENNKEYDVVVKVKNPNSTNHFGATSLACELICSIILRSCGLDTPDYAIVNVSDSLAASIPVSEDRNLMFKNKGENFGTVFHKGATTWYPHKQSTVSDAHLYFVEDVLAFDSTVINGDRKMDKPNILQTGKNLLMIDHSLALPVCAWSNEQITVSPLFPEKQIKEHCGYYPLNQKKQSDRVIFDFTKVPGIWNKVFSEKEWKTIRSFIPLSWEEKSGDLDKIFCFLQTRSKRFPEITESLRSIVK